MTKLPVVIAGAGPCGLVTAITLQQEGIPYVIVERASRTRLCSNAGSAYDLAPTSTDILSNRLGIPKQYFQICGGSFTCSMDGKELRSGPMSDLSEDDNNRGYATANRAAMQECFLKFLLDKEKSKGSFTESTVLKCGVQVTGYHENQDSVTVKLSNGSSVVGSALLGCDGIHSTVRKSLMASLPEPIKDDQLHFCNVVCWWGKMEVKPGTDFYRALDATQKYKDDGNSFIYALGNPHQPGSFMGAPMGDVFMWVFVQKSSEEPNKTSDDLTSRGGATLDDFDKRELESIVQNRGDLIRLAVQDTPASAITKAGLYDRTNLNLPYVQGHVALLGDAAHPQSPMMGQGCNQAIADAYVCAMRLSKQPTKEALEAFDSEERRKAVNAVIEKARSVGDMMCSDSRLMCWIVKLFFVWMPASWLWADMIKGDIPNKNFVKKLDEDLGAKKKSDAQCQYDG